MFYFLIGGWVMLSVLIFSIVVNYLCGLFRHWLSSTLAVTINISLFAILLTQEFPQTAFGLAFPLLSLLPLGVSFYTFSAISYNVDVYKRRINPVRNFIDFGLYLSFFPTAVAGPILKATDFIPQLRKFYQVTSRGFSIALFLILCGLIKIAIADFIALNLTSEYWLIICGYIIRIYCVFSGYTNIATGSAAILGFKTTPLSYLTWLRDYIYIPLGGKRRAHNGTQKARRKNIFKEAFCDLPLVIKFLVTIAVVAMLFFFKTTCFHYM